ncbi:helix-turn-helix domain-containing protein [Blastococcus montanus]|uniref:helix-turn-helix domain-containing protein n=1 Tax=Blastococcus montanus TaxID=3144973 RepID=UPI00320AEF64
MGSPRDYGQFCGLAAGLNVIGNRWTLLIIRELLLGPVRFNDLVANLPGIGSNLLAERLQGLAAAGVIEVVPVAGDRRGKSYQLTERGQELKGPLLLLARWGLSALTEQDSKGVVRAEWAIIALEAMVTDDSIPTLDEAYEFVIDGVPVVVTVQDGVVSIGRGAPVADVALRVTSDAETFVRVGARLIDPLEAVAQGLVKLEGDMVAADRCIRLLNLA